MNYEIQAQHDSLWIKMYTTKTNTWSSIPIPWKEGNDSPFDLHTCEAHTSTRNKLNAMSF